MEVEASVAVWWSCTSHTYCSTRRAGVGTGARGGSPANCTPVDGSALPVVLMCHCLRPACLTLWLDTVAGLSAS